MKIKKTVLSALICFMFANCFSLPVYASEVKNNVSTDIIYYENGDYVTIEIESITSDIRSTTNKSYTKTYTYRDSDGVAQWDYKLTASFSYNGSSSSCTPVTDSYSIYDNNWHMDSHSCYRDGNRAVGSFTMKRKTLGITTKTISDTVTLTCSPNGSIS